MWLKNKDNSEDKGAPPGKYVNFDNFAYYEVRIVFLTCLLMT
jgi:hypothetical protein